MAHDSWYSLNHQSVDPDNPQLVAGFLLMSVGFGHASERPASIPRPIKKKMERFVLRCYIYQGANLLAADPVTSSTNPFLVIRFGRCIWFGLFCFVWRVFNACMRVCVCVRRRVCVCAVAGACACVNGIDRRRVGAAIEAFQLEWIGAKPCYNVFIHACLSLSFPFPLACNARAHCNIASACACMRSGRPVPHAHDRGLDVSLLVRDGRHPRGDRQGLPAQHLPPALPPNPAPVQTHRPMRRTGHARHGQHKRYGRVRLVRVCANVRARVGVRFALKVFHFLVGVFALLSLVGFCFT